MGRWKIITGTSIQSMVKDYGRAWIMADVHLWTVQSHAEQVLKHTESPGLSFPVLASPRHLFICFCFTKHGFFDTHWCLTRPGSLHNPSRLWVGRLRTHGTLDSDHFPSLQMVRLSSPRQLSAHIHFWLVPIARNVTRPPGLVLLVFEPFRLP